MSKARTVALALSATVSACATGLGPIRPDAYADARAHSIFVDGDGRPLRPDTIHAATIVGSSTHGDSAYGEWIHGILMGLAASGRHDVLLRIHGGVTPLNLVAGDTALTARIMRESPYYPIYINWESSIQASYLDQLFYVRDGRAYRGWDARGVWLSPLYLASDAGRAIARAPVTWSVQARKFIGELHSSDGIVSASAKRDQSLLFSSAATTGSTNRCAPNAKPLTSESTVRIEYGPDCRRAWERALDVGLAVATTVGVLPYDRRAERIGHNSVGRMSLKLPSHLFWPSAKLFSPWATHHIAWLPLRPISSLVIDMVGSPSYLNMHRRTKTMFRPSPERARAGAGPLSYNPASGGVAELLDSLQAFVAQTGDTARPSRCSWSASADAVARAAGEPYRVTIVGASLGANIATEIVRGCPGISFTNIVFLGAAASERDVEQGIVPYLRADTTARFFNLTLNPAADRDEWPAGLFFSTQGSLVEWLDGFMTTPETDEDRVFGKYENAMSAIHLLPQSIRRRVFYKSFGYYSAFGNFGVPYRHADLALGPFWKCEYWMPAVAKAECAAPAAAGPGGR